MQKNNASIGSDVLENIIQAYPHLNVVWLITGEGEMLKKDEEELILDFDDLPKDKQQEIENIIEQKIKERQEEELKRFLKEVNEEIEKNRKKLGKKD